MKSYLNKLFFIAVSLLLSTAIYGQKGDAILILKDSTRLKGTGEISGIHSIVSIKFKNDSLKYRTYDANEIIGIDIKEYDFFRKYRYKETDTSKYPELLEIIFIDKVSLYLKIFGNGSLPRSVYYQLDEKRNKKFEGNPEETEFYKWLRANVDIFVNDAELERIEERELKKMILSQAFMGDNFSRISYYIGRKEDDKVEHLFDQGLPLSKNFKKAMKEKFDDCPALIDKVDDKTFTKKDVVQVLYFYNTYCLQE